MIQTATLHRQPFGRETAAVRRFRETLSSQDQQALDELLDTFAAHHQAKAQPVAPLPIELFLITLLLEQQKTIQFLVSRLNYYDHKLYLRCVKNVPIDDAFRRKGIG